MNTSPSPLVGRFDHADDRRENFSPDELARIDRHVRELIAERLADPAQFADLMTGIEPTAYYPMLQRIVLNVMRPKLGPIEIEAITIAACQLAGLLRGEAKLAWGDECTERAELEVSE